MTDSSDIDPAQPETLLPVGQVAALLGVPAVTLRSWERRYDVGPSQRSAGRHRRYNRSDVERLQRMRNLIATGMPTREAVALSAVVTGRDGHPRADLWAELEAQYVVDLASRSRVQSLADELQACLSQRGVSATWNEVVGPALRMLGARYLSSADCIDIELVVTQAMAEAVDRHLDQFRPRARDPRHPVLLICCPGERHHLPLKILQAVLLEQAIPAVLLGPGLPSAAAMTAIARFDPSVVVLWSMVRRRDLTGLHRTIAATGVATCAAGPGWPRGARPVTTLESAADSIGNLWVTASSSHRGRRTAVGR